VGGDEQKKPLDRAADDSIDDELWRAATPQLTGFTKY
jgi:hypothetical protein